MNHKLLVSPPTNPRHAAHSSALAMAEKYDHTLRLRLLRLNMLNAALEVRVPKGDGGALGTSMMGGESISASLRRLGQMSGF